MSRISIDVTPEQHQKLKALAALCGKSIKDFVLERTLGESEADAGLAEIEAMLDARISEARARGASTRTVGDVFKQARDELSADNGGIRPHVGMVSEILGSGYQWVDEVDP